MNPPIKPINVPSFSDIEWFETTDKLAWYINKLEKGREIKFTLEHRTWLKPIDIILLVLTIKFAHEKTQLPVKIDKMQPYIDKYLRSINFYELLNQICVNPSSSLSLLKRFSDPLPSSKQVVLTEMRSHELSDIDKFVSQAFKVLDYYYPGKDLGNFKDRIITTIWEACSNGVQHSESSTYGVIQSYNQKVQNEVCIAIGDLGIGIRNHLTKKYPYLKSDYDILKSALNGVSGREGKNGGNGLRRIQEICRLHSGSFSIRSGSLTYAIFNDKTVEFISNRYQFPGTQLNIVLRSEICS